MAGLVLVTAPTLEPLSLSEAKEQLRITSDDEDGYITRLIKAARMHVEQVTSKSLISTTWRQDLDEFPCYAIVLERSPVSAVSWVKYYDTNNTLQTFSSASYNVDTSHTRPYVALAYTASWPTTYDKPNAVQVQYVAGYGAFGSSVDEDLRHAVELLVAHWYEHREPVVIGQAVNSVPRTVEALLMPHRMALV